ncbi:AMP-binding protein [Nocardioides albus]|uniref:AMP-binding protein n=1 Tax=Nocardioides albus TaxID=1841 RepID=UPI001982F7F2|nr:AMP-binding protein [Nocardioides albus]GGU27686.1 putative fatty-acid-CoA ligase FadD [Nocardioides albus]
MMETLAEILRSRAGDGRVGLRFEERSWTWAEVVQESADRAALLDHLVARPATRQTHVGVLLDNVPDYVFWLGAAALGAGVVVGLNTSRNSQEIADDVRHADVDVIITETRHRGLVEGIAHVVPSGLILEVDSAAYGRLLGPFRGSAMPTANPTAAETAVLLYSSGSTSAPKAVIVSHGRLAGLTAAIIDRIGLERSSVTYLAMPLFHGNAVMMNLVPAMAAGATVGLARRFSASRFSADIHRFGATYTNYVGRALAYVLNTPEDPRDRSSTLRLAYGTEASETDIARFAERFGCVVQEGYGMSEGVFRLNRVPGTPPGSLGKAVGGVDVRVLDETTGEECPRATIDSDGRLDDSAAIGQLVAVGAAHTFEGYYRNPVAMADRVRGDDFWSGDLAYRDADGWFYFAGRASDWLRVDGENFSAAQVENVLARVPGVAASLVYAVPDPSTGDQVMCALELVAGTEFDPDAFGEFVSQQADMGGKWWPTYVRLIGRVPLTGSNKVDKAPLRRMGWNTTDPVFRRVGRTSAYERLGESARTAIEKEFRLHERAHLLPRASDRGCSPR